MTDKPQTSAKHESPRTVQVPARAVPVPPTLSAEAVAYLSMGLPPMGASDPPLHDKAAWKDRIAIIDRLFDSRIDRMLAAPARVERVTLGGVSICIGMPHEMLYPDRAYISIHGGGFRQLGGRYVLGDAAQMAADFGCLCYSVDYRMPPDHPLPAAMDDCVAVYREVIERHPPAKTIMAGASAGGNLTVVSALKINALGLPLPGVLGLMSPVTDFAYVSDSLYALQGVDAVLSGPIESIPAMYAPGIDRKDPRLSPVYADYSKPFPPSFLQTGTRDLLLSDTIRLHRALANAGHETELHVWEAMPHGGFGSFAPEDKEVTAQFLRFINKHLG